MLRYVPRTIRKKRCLFIFFCIFLYFRYYTFFLNVGRISKSSVHLIEMNYDTNFSWPLNADIKQCANILESEGYSNCSKINSYDFSYISSCENKCYQESNVTLKLLFIVKSKLDNFEQRSAIRKSWGSENLFHDIPLRTVFLLGVEMKRSEVQDRIEQESKTNGDIIQANFIDSYWNNTIKIMMGIQWAIKFCKNSKFYIFSDDDMFVNPKNMLKFVGDPFNYSKYLENETVSLQKDSVLPNDVKFYAGPRGVPYVSRKPDSKWYVPVNEYPFNKYPQYIPAACFVLSYNALKDLYFGGFYTKYFRLDDAYLGLVAEKMGLERLFFNDIHYVEKPYDRLNYRYVIASHGYYAPDKLLKVWNDQKSAGYT